MNRLNWKLLLYASERLSARQAGILRPFPKSSVLYAGKMGLLIAKYERLQKEINKRQEMLKAKKHTYRLRFGWGSLKAGNSLPPA